LRRESSCGRDDEFPNRQILHRGYSDENEKEYTRKDGTVFPVAVRSWLSRDEAGDPAGIWMLVRDITGQKALEQQRIMNEKMTALGMMAGGVAHELNNPMMGIGGFIEYCLKHTQKEDRRYEILEDAARETSRCVDLVKNLLTFSHTEQSSEEDYEWVECERLFDRVSRLLAHRIEKDRVLVTKQICEKSRRIYARANALQQVFLNLMTNALDAVKDVPKKEICFTVQPVQEDVLIRISDTGKGMEPDRKKRIFDPFFTTKPVGKGTGLGLSVTRSIVESLGGRVGCESEPGKGTRMDIVIPGKKDSK
jgi:signal transduction histidine kinase